MRENRKARVIFSNLFAGIISESLEGYIFTYDYDYTRKGIPISVNLPFNKMVYQSRYLPVFFKSLLPEGWYRDIVGRKLKIDENDDFGFLIKTCRDTIGAVWIEEIEDE